MPALFGIEYATVSFMYSNLHLEFPK